MTEVKDKNGTTLAIIHRKSNWKDGLDFITKETDFLQVGTWNYNKDKSLDRHHHNRLKRSSSITQECVILLSGSMNVEIFDLDRCLVSQLILEQGDLAVFLDGGHAYQILEDNTRIVECKNGPFLGVELDKTRF